jgi:hypothetical protein
MLPHYPVRLHCDEWTVDMFNLMLGIVGLPSIMHIIMISIKNTLTLVFIWILTLAPFALPILYQPTDYCQKFTPHPNSFYTPELIRDLVEKAPRYFLIMMIVQHGCFLIRVVLSNWFSHCEMKEREKEIRADIIMV